jgi:predicted RNA binding protein YcfA (HicA-like mRNA interferase family)
MSKIDKILLKILTGTSDTNISFNELCLLLKSFDFEERIKGSHHIFTREDIDEILNIQPKESKAKPYQVKQVRDIFVKYEIGNDEDEYDTL